jgi:hypothetical protein
MEDSLPEPESLQGFTIRVTEGLLTQLNQRVTGQPRQLGEKTIQAHTPRERQLIEQVVALERRKRVELAKRLQLRLQQLEERRLAQARETAEQRLKELEKMDYILPMRVGVLPCESEREALLDCYSKSTDPLQCAALVASLEHCAKGVELQVLRRPLEKPPGAAAAAMDAAGAPT